MTGKKESFCGSSDHLLSRRGFLARASSGAAATMAGTGLFGSPGFAKELKNQDKRVIMLWLAGGASQFETWDPKPGRDTGGPFFDMGTKIPGVRISELMPEMAQRIHKHTAIIRSLNTKDGAHARASQLMMRGRNNEPNLKYPDLGAIVAHELAQADSQVPDYVNIYSQTEGRNFAKVGPAFLPPRHAPIQLTERMGLENARRLESISQIDHEERNDLRRLLSDRFARGRQSAAVGSHQTAYDRVRGLMASDKWFDISQEPEKVRRRYGPTRFGEQTLIARRLIEAGVPFVRVARAWWDSHAQNFETHLELVPEFDRVMSALLDDLEERGLLENTLVITTAEFGRTPKINASLGRDHFATAWSSTLSGMGVTPGAVYGKTDPDGQSVVDGEIGAGEFFATILEALGIDHTHELYVGPRPIPLVDVGIEPVWDVLS